MTLLASLLVLLAALVHATWNLLAKSAASAGGSFVFAYSLFGFGLYAPWAAMVVWSGETVWSLPGLASIGASSVIHLAYGLALQRGYQTADLSVVYPVARGAGPTLSALTAIALLGETPSTRGLLGLLAVVLGILLIATQGDLSTFRTPRARAGVRWGLLTGGLIAAYTVIDGHAVKALGVHPVLLDCVSNGARSLMLAPALLRHAGEARDKMRGHWRVALWVGLLSPLSYILVLSAMRWGAPISLVAPARETSMMAGVIFGMLILREQVGPARVAGCALLVAGVAMLSAA